VVSEIDRNDFRTFESFLKRSVRRTGSCSEINYGFGINQQWFEPRQQSIARSRVHEIGLIEGGCRSFKATTYVFAVQHWRNVSTLL
jgi:hypothetical protein